MPVVNQYGPAPQLVAQAAYQAGIGRAYQRNAARANDMQFNADQAAIDRETRLGMQQSSQEFAMAQDAMQRDAMLADREAQNAAALSRMSAQQRLDVEEAKARQQLETQGLTERFTKQQELERAQVDEQLRRLDSGHPDYDFPPAVKQQFRQDLLAQRMGIKGKIERVPTPQDFQSQLADGPGGSKIDPTTGKQYMPPKLTKEQADQQLQMEAEKVALDKAKVLQGMTRKKKGPLGEEVEEPIYTPEEVMQLSGLSAFLPQQQQQPPQQAPAPLPMQLRTPQQRNAADMLERLIASHGDTPPEQWPPGDQNAARNLYAQLQGAE
jgi:hypothetical protein